jgi:intergrase/recombinase
LWIREVQPLLYDDERLFLRFLAVTGLRKIEAIASFNMIIELNARGKLGEYYNEDSSTLEHFKFGRLFLRGTKNAFISIVPKAMIPEIANSQPVTYDAIHCRLMRRRIPLRLKELRSYHNSYLRKNGIISELVDVLAGRVPKSVFCRHYPGMDMKTFSSQVLAITEKLEKALTS